MAIEELVISGEFRPAQIDLHQVQH